MRTLEVLNFDPSRWVDQVYRLLWCLITIPRVMVHPRILAWYNNLEQQELLKGLECSGEDWPDMDADDAEGAF